MHLRRDDRALESLPLKLVIVVVVATMSVLPAARALAGLEDREFARRAGLELDRIVTAAELLTVRGPGNVRTISLDFSSDGGLSYQNLTAGDRQGGPNASGVVLRLSNGARITRLAEDPQCVLRSVEGDALVATQPRFDLRMAAVLEGGMTVIVLELV